jgi:amidophosphoribosyltransferase
LREAGAAEVHMRISSPPYRWPCFYGMDTGSRSELLAANMDVEEIRTYLGVDTLSYLTLDALVDAVGAPGAGFCTACLTGEYPVAITVESSSSQAAEGAAAAPVRVEQAPLTLLDAGAGLLPAEEAALLSAQAEQGDRDSDG